MNINSAVISGTIISEAFSHCAHGLNFRKIILENKRTSHATNTINVIYQSNDKLYEEKQRIKVSGTIRSRREGKQLQLYLYADEIEAYSGEEVNELIIEGYVCSDPYFKILRNRKLTQFLICSDNMRRVYASVLVWKKTKINIGNKLVICGRLQSRIYYEKNRSRMVNEISAYRIDLC